MEESAVELAYIRRLLATSDYDVDARDARGRTCLQRAVEWPDSTLVQVMIAHGADVNAIDMEGRRSLHHAAYWSQAGAIEGSFDARPEIMRHLLAAGAVLEAIDGYGDTALSLANDNGRVSSVRLLLNAGAKPDTHGTHGCSTPSYILDFLQNPNESDAIARLLNEREDINAKDEWGHTLLDRAAWLGSPAAVMALLSVRANPNVSGRHDNRPLHFAAELMNHPEGERAIRALVQAGAKLDVQNSYGNTPLLVAAAQGSAPAVLLLLHEGADPNIRSSTSEYAPLHYAFALMGHADGAAAVHALLNVTVDIHPRHGGVATPLSRAAFHGSLLAVRALWGTRTGSLSPGEYQQVEDSLYQNDPGAELVIALLEGEHNANAQNIRGLSLLQLAITIRAVPLVQRLLSRGATIRVEATLAMMKQLREDTNLSPPSNRDKGIKILSLLYRSIGYYPLEPALHEWEVAKEGLVPAEKGGFGECFQGSFLGRHKVALKQCLARLDNQTAERRALREIEVWKGLRHRHVLPFLGWADSQSRIYMMSPWMKNGHAREYLIKNQGADCVLLLLQTAVGLQYLHKRCNSPIVHGDLKGPNILITDNREACIGDFGLSYWLAAESYSLQSDAWLKGGNPRWQAPELLDGDTFSKQNQRTTRSDIFAFGRVIVELLTREPPFEGITSTSVIIKVMRKEGPARPRTLATECDKRMWELASKCCSFDAVDRPDIDQVILSLQDIIQARDAPRPRFPGFRLPWVPLP